MNKAPKTGESFDIRLEDEHGIAGHLPTVPDDTGDNVNSVAIDCTDHHALDANPFLKDIESSSSNVANSGVNRNNSLSPEVISSPTTENLLGQQVSMYMSSFENPEERPHLSDRSKGKRRNLENFSGPAKRLRVTEHATGEVGSEVPEDNCTQTLDVSRVLDDAEMMDVDNQSIIGHLPRVSKETISDVNDILDGCEDIQILEHYLQEFVGRFTAEEDGKDLNQLIRILHKISELSQNTHTTSIDARQTEFLLTKYLYIRWSRTHDECDAKESVSTLLQLFNGSPFVKDVSRLLSNTLDGHTIKENGDDRGGISNRNVSTTEAAPGALEKILKRWLTSKIDAVRVNRDTSAERKRMFYETWGEWWNVEYFPEHEEGSRLSDHFIQILNKDILEQLLLTSDGNVAEIQGCQDPVLLAHYLCIFEDRFQKRWDIADLERQIVVLRRIISLSSDQDLIQQLQRGIVMVLFHPKVLSHIRGGFFKSEDLEMIIGFARKCLAQDPSDRAIREGLYNGLVSRREKDQSSESTVNCLEEALECVPGDEAKQTFVLLQLLWTRFFTSDGIQKGGRAYLEQRPKEEREAYLQDLVGWAKPTFDKVWEKKHLIMSELEVGEVQGVRAQLVGLLFAVYEQTLGVEYVHRLVEILYKPSTGPEAELQPLLKQFVLIGRSREYLNVKDLRLAVQLIEEHFQSKYMGGLGEIDYQILGALHSQYFELYIATNSVDAAEKLLQYTHLAILNPPPRDNPLHGYFRDSSVRGLVTHFLSNPACNIRSLREALDASSMLSADPEYTTEQLYDLAKGYCALFQINWNIPTIDFAIRCFRMLVERIPSSAALVDLACVLFLREDYLRSIADYVQVNVDDYATNLQLTEAIKEKIILDSIHQMNRQDPPEHAKEPTPELQITMTDFMLRGGFKSDVESEWYYLTGIALEMSEAQRKQDPHKRGTGVKTDLQAIICRAQFSGECMDIEIRHKHILAFKEALAILQKIFADRGSTFRSQRGIIDDQLVVFKNLLEVPFTIAHYANCWEEVKSAVEFLDYGRSIIWSRMRRLRITDSQLTGVSDDLRSQFLQTCEEIDQLATFEPQPDPESLSKPLRNGDSKVERVDFPSEIHSQRKALETNLSSMVEEIRKIPGYEDFLRMASFEKLQTAACGGPVIIVTMASRELMVQTYQPVPLFGHAIIVLGSGDPVLVTLDMEGFEDRVNKVNESLDRIRRKPGSESSNSELMEVLEEIGELIVKDVVAALMSLGIEDQSRIWWCLTTVFSSFPIHAAMWRYKAKDGKSRLMCLNDLYVSSYTPSLAALIQARSPPPRSKVAQSSGTMLVIKQQDAQLATADKEVENIVLAASKTGHSFGDSFKLYNGDENERTDVLKDLPDYDWIHLTCHGVLDATDPFSSHFQISGGIDGVEKIKKITIMDILRSRVPNAEFAFLSACHTAELPEHFSREESLHLAAAMQFCGYRSVVGTMWPLNDDGGPRVAKAFYEYMFAEPKEGEEVGYLRAARALNKVTQRMRRHPDYKNYPERWVNFVHIGA
ncbi:hypothetical protein SCHPADRAFT_1000239 [Schizopora paradoxa]|uniref:CHAT domain-containing protein n=1 Tax=Schizopora paradoxa TaxID=27342 RepID=A0A0H2RC89_9AGAM|nr:hypothetical protein SCHPADRAFT_1000239 [Schizopora paradoxa]